MSFRALRSWEENKRARDELTRRGLSFWPKRPPRSLRDRLRRRPYVDIGELNKSWDVLSTVELLEREHMHKEPVLDLGAFGSEILCALREAGFTDLTGIDLNPRIRAMPYGDVVKWLVGDAMETGLPSAHYAAVTAISALEHGYQPKRLLAEVSRLLRTGGVFVGSTDYWREKIDTSGVRLFDMDWRIFSGDEIREFFAIAKSFSLAPVGDIDLACEGAPIDYAGRLYTFGWFALRKT